jgi:hypothetical protein
LNISTGLAKTALAAPAIAPDEPQRNIMNISGKFEEDMRWLPARDVSGRDSWGKGEIMRFEIPYEAKSNEFTPAIPTSGLAMPVSGTQILVQYSGFGVPDLCITRRSPPYALSALRCS